jgi:hypothetical protein
MISRAKGGTAPWGGTRHVLYDGAFLLEGPGSERRSQAESDEASLTSDE